MKMQKQDFPPLLTESLRPGPSESCRRRMCPKQDMNWWQHEMLRSRSGEALIVHKGPRAAGEGVFGSLSKDLRIAKSQVL